MTNYDAKSVLKTLESKTIKNEETSCWLWIGYCDAKGYGRIKFRGYTTRVHRISAHIHLGYDLTEKILQVLHKLECPNKNCWNPEHIYIGTNKENQIDKATLGNTGSKALGLICNYGHERAIYQDSTGHCRECDRIRHNINYISRT